MVERVLGKDEVSSSILDEGSNHHSAQGSFSHPPPNKEERTMAKENRELRLAAAEKKAAALPAKLTVPMILFFLPVLFIVILGPAAIRVMQMNVMN